jgi:diguanylate cyclase (GGDEF)-like protein
MRLGLGAKFSLMVLTILTVTIAANSLYALYRSAGFHEKQLNERGLALGRLIALVSPEAILGFDFLLLNDYTRQLSKQPDVVYGVIIGNKGLPLSAYVDDAHPDVKRQLDAAKPEQLLDLMAKVDEQADLIRLDFPIVHNDASLGKFIVGLSRASLRAEFRQQMAVHLLALTIIVLFLSCAIHIVFRLSVLRPIQKLISASEQVGRGQFHPVTLASSDEFGLLANAFNAMADEVRQEQAKLHRQANFDTLTGLPNRMMALDRIDQEIHRSHRTSQRFALFFIDLDNFKSVNDSMGHAVGDELLVATGTRLCDAVREADTVARLGGDEFLILAPDVPSDVEVEQIAERLIRSISEPQVLNGRKVVARCSIGIAFYPENGRTVEALMANADNAMYQAKAAGQGSAIFFTEEMNTRLRERMQMEQDLNLALDAGQLQLYFQPIFDAATRNHCGAEVLLRWQHPERGFVSPADFIPLAEESGQIVSIGEWVLEEACRYWAAWRDSGIDPGYLAINISRIQFRKRFSVKLADMMAQRNIPSEALALEITESVLLDDHDHVAEELNTLRDLGLKLSLDDFGTGYSSLSYLKRFRFDVLKIDRSFVAGVPDNSEDVSLVKAILAMARGLDLKVVAEGVENESQLAFLCEQRCELAQGYLLAKPMDARSYTDFINGLRAPLIPVMRRSAA